MFRFTAQMYVTHANRDVEFIELKRKIEEYCRTHFSGHVDSGHELSCEMMAEELCLQFNLGICEVSEDGENSGRVEVVTDPDTRELLLDSLRIYSGAPYQGGKAYKRPAPRRLTKQEVENRREAKARKREDEWDALDEYEDEKPQNPLNARELKHLYPFVGKECEGPPDIRGVTTMFIPGDCTTSEQPGKGWWSYMKPTYGIIRALYFGAGNKPIIDDYGTQNFSRITGAYSHIVVEVRSCDDAQERVEDLIAWADGKRTKELPVVYLISHKLDDAAALADYRDDNSKIRPFIKLHTAFECVWMPIVNSGGTALDAASYITNLNNEAYEKDMSL